jgi:hypothetical protein
MNSSAPMSSTSGMILNPFGQTIRGPNNDKPLNTLNMTPMSYHNHHSVGSIPSINGNSNGIAHPNNMKPMVPSYLGQQQQGVPNPSLSSSHFPTTASPGTFGYKLIPPGSASLQPMARTPSSTPTPIPAASLFPTPTATQLSQQSPGVVISDIHQAKSFDDVWRIDSRTILHKRHNAIVYGVVHRKEKGVKAAVKLYLVNKSDRVAVENEIICLHVLSVVPNKNVLAWKQSFQSDMATYIVLERIRGCELLKHIVKNPQRYSTGYNEHEIRKWCGQMVAALQHCHRNGVVHRNVKPGNFVLARNGYDTTLKLMDFSKAVRVRYSHSYFLGCIVYNNLCL